jgi:hypothetical protein
MKKIIIFLSVIPFMAYAITQEQKDAAYQANIKELQHLGLPTPDSGVQLVPRESLKMQKWKKQQFASESNELKENGYIKKSSDRAYELIHIQEQIKKNNPKQDALYKDTSSELRKSPAAMRFAYTYVGVPNNDIVALYGIAPVGTYVKEPQEGWTGAVTFFKSSFASCAYTENNMVAAHGAAQIAEEDSSDDINGKITLIDIEGNDSTGYLYRINWFDNVFNRNLECATKDYSRDYLMGTIALAKKIDKYY